MSRYTLSSRDTLVCFNARERGTCSNRRAIKRQEVEARALHAMRELFFERGAFTEFCRGFADEMAIQRREHSANLARARREIVFIERRQSEILKALSEGYRSEAWKTELIELDGEKGSLTAALVEPPVPAMHPRMAEVFQEKVTALCEGLERESGREEARAALRGLVDRIVIPPGTGLLRVEGNLGAMLTVAHGRAVKAGAAVGIVGCGGGI